VISERDLKSQFRSALEEVTPPAPWLKGAVASELKQRRQTGLRSIPGPRLVGSLAAALLAAVLIASLVIGLRLWPFAPQPAHPGIRILTIEEYQAVTKADGSKFLTVSEFICSSFDDTTCLPKVTLADAATQRWLDDLSHSQAPARFAVLDDVIRRNLARVLAIDKTFVMAFKAKDSKGTGAASTDISNVILALEGLYGDITLSSQGTLATYTAFVKADAAALVAAHMSCEAGQAPACADDIATVKRKVEAFEGNLVRFYAPESLAAKDAHLRADLVAADRAITVMESALPAGNKAVLQSGLVALRQALAQTAVDAATITG
jgi:hypothetical protein